MLETSTLVIWTLVLAGAIVLALAGYLSAIAWYLYRAGGGARSHLAKLAGGLEAVAGNAAPLEERINTIAGALSALDQELTVVAANLRRTAEALRR